MAEHRKPELPASDWLLAIIVLVAPTTLWWAAMLVYSELDTANLCWLGVAVGAGGCWLTLQVEGALIAAAEGRASFVARPTLGRPLGARRVELGAEPRHATLVILRILLLLAACFLGVAGLCSALDTYPGVEGVSLAGSWYLLWQGYLSARLARRLREWTEARCRRQAEA